MRNLIFKNIFRAETQSWSRSLWCGEGRSQVPNLLTTEQNNLTKEAEAREIHFGHKDFYHDYLSISITILWGFLYHDYKDF